MHTDRPVQARTNIHSVGPQFFEITGVYVSRVTPSNRSCQCAYS